MTNQSNENNMKIAFVIIHSIQTGFSWLIEEENTIKIIARSHITYSSKIDAFLDGADVATSLGYAPREKWEE